MANRFWDGCKQGREGHTQAVRDGRHCVSLQPPRPTPSLSSCCASAACSAAPICCLCSGLRGLSRASAAGDERRPAPAAAANSTGRVARLPQERAARLHVPDACPTELLRLARCFCAPHGCLHLAPARGAGTGWRNNISDAEVAASMARSPAAAPRPAPCGIVRHRRAARSPFWRSTGPVLTEGYRCRDQDC